MEKTIFLSLLLCLFLHTQSQNLPTLPEDPSLKTGKLSNGLTYYIRHNPASTGYTSYYLVQNVGSLLEKDSQNGLAHFLEHMAFNGSLHYPGKSMLRMLEKQGISLNQGIMAYTSLNETLYGLDHVPNTAGMMDSCLLILHDWSHFLNLDSAAIEKERRVILEEWRTRRDADFRLKAQTTPILMQGSQYAIRDIIGDTTVIQTIQQKDFRNFYKTWYRPDLQAIVIVGDVDPDKTEQLIHKMFADIPAPQHAPERPFFELPLNQKFIYVQATDPETPRVRIRISTLQKNKAGETSSATKMKEALQKELFNRLMRERLYEMFRKNNVPALGYSLVRHDPQRGYNALTITVIPRPGDEEKVVKAALTEKERVKQFGFTEKELQRAKIILQREAETASSTPDKQTNAYYIEKYSQNYLEGIPVPDPAAYLKFIRQELPRITSEQLTTLLKEWDDGTNYAVSVTGPEQMTKITSSQFQEWLTATQQLKLSPYQEEHSEEPLFTQALPEGKIIQEKLLENFGAKEWTLSNGAKVVFKPVASEPNISLLAFREGGTANCTREELAIANVLPILVNNYGTGKLDALQLDKILSIKDVSCSVNLRPSYEAMAGQAPTGELETLLQMLWLRFEQPRFDPAIHRGLINSFKTQWAMHSKDPFQQMNDTVVATLGNYDPRSLPFQMSQFDEITLEKTEQFYRKKFAEPASFTFLITGKGDEELIKKMVEKYIGSFSPAQPRVKSGQENAIFPTWKKLTKICTYPASEQKSTVLINLTCELDYNRENEYYSDLLGNLTELKSMKELREKDGAVYNVSVQKEFEAQPAGKAILMVCFDCAPDREQELSERVNRIFNELAQKGPREEELQKAIENLKAKQNLTAENNSWWINTLFAWYFHQVNKADKDEMEQRYTNTTPQSCRSFFRKFLKKAHQTEFFFQPETPSGH